MLSKSHIKDDINMPDIEALITTIVKPLVEHPEELSIEIVDTDDFTEYHLLCILKISDALLAKRAVLCALFVRLFTAYVIATKNVLALSSQMK